MTKPLSVRELLRSHTQAAHRRLDERWDIARLGERDVYTQFLQATAAALIPLEIRLTEAGVSRVLDDWEQRRRTAAMLADLAGLAATVPCHAAPPLSDTGAMFGALYVLEGSRLGGALIAREVGASSDPAVLANRRYIAHGAGGSLWRSFVAQLDALPASACDQLCAGAIAAFELFERAAFDTVPA